MIKEFAGSKRAWLTLAAVLLLIAADVARSQGVDLTEGTIDRIMGALALLAGMDAYKPLGKPRG